MTKTKNDNYFEGNSKSGIQLEPQYVIIMCLIFIGIVVSFHFYDKLKE